MRKSIAATAALAVMALPFLALAPAKALSTGNGVEAEYFTQGAGGVGTYGGLSYTRTDPNIDFNWGTGGPGAPLGGDNFLARWQAQVEATTTGTYTFETYSDDGVKLWVNGQLLVDNWTVHAPVLNTGTISLTAGQRYSFRLDYFENTGGAVASVRWTPPGQAHQVIPQSQLYSPTLGTTRTENDPPGNKYAYAPSAVLDTGGHYNIYSCENQVDGVVTDSIDFLRRDVNHTQTYEQFIQQPSPSPAWDENHNCDPSMIKGSFNLGGTNYLYANFYTGNYYGCGANGNAVGVSLSNSQPATYVKAGIVIPHTGATCDWGTGQPSAVSADNGSNVHLFYTDGHCKMSDVNLSDAANPVVSPPVDITSNGIVDPGGTTNAWLHNCDFAYDAPRHRYFMTHDSTASNPLSITEVWSIDASHLTDGTWRWEADIPSTRAGASVSVFANNGFERDWYGNLTSTSSPVVFSSGRTSAGLFTYNVYSTPINIPAG